MKFPLEEDIDNIKNKDKQVIDRYRDWYLCALAEPRLQTAAIKNLTLKVTTENGTFIFKPVGKLAGLCIDAPEDSEFKIGTWYTPTLGSDREAVKSSIGPNKPRQLKMQKLKNSWLKLRDATIGDTSEFSELSTEEFPETIDGVPFFERLEKLSEQFLQEEEIPRTTIINQDDVSSSRNPSIPTLRIPSHSQNNALIGLDFNSELPTTPTSQNNKNRPSELLLNQTRIEQYPFLYSNTNVRVPNLATIMNNEIIKNLNFDITKNN